MKRDDGEMSEEHQKNKESCRFWIWALSSVIFRLILISFPGNLNISSLAEGYWWKQASMSPYAGSMYHGSPLLSLLGPLTVQRIERYNRCFVELEKVKACLPSLARRGGWWSSCTCRRSTHECFSGSHVSVLGFGLCVEEEVGVSPL